MKEKDKKVIMDKVLQYGMKMSQGKYVSAQRLYTEIDRTLKTDREEFFGWLDK